MTTSKQSPRPISESQRMLIRRTSPGILGTALADASAYFTAMVEMLADAFEPDLDAWETLPVAHATAQLVS
ncbi:thiazole synthase [Mycobacterium sp. 2YAF39]|uniref:thiazole synthase n=1 Tax=Mycobacterium sp. 2YAF39 TaxID=3233033 RepID=UPI003F9B5CBB